MPWAKKWTNFATRWTVFPLVFIRFELLLLEMEHSSIQRGIRQLGAQNNYVTCSLVKNKIMTTLETINTLQVICLVLLGWIIFMVGWLMGAQWGKRNRV